MEWRKSSFCSTDQATEQCVEVAQAPDSGVLVRDYYGRVVEFSPAEFSAFVDGVKAGEFDDLT